MHLFLKIRVNQKGEAQKIIEGYGAKAVFHGPPLRHTYNTYIP
jgi:hypothetical protein